MGLPYGRLVTSGFPEFCKVPYSERSSVFGKRLCAELVQTGRALLFCRIEHITHLTSIAAEVGKGIIFPNTVFLFFLNKIKSRNSREEVMLEIPFNRADYLIVLNNFIIYKLNLDRKLGAVQNAATLLGPVVAVVLL